MRRLLDWDGCAWARDLGGLPLERGGTTRHGGLVRAGHLDSVTPAGWHAIEAHGIRTIVDLRNHGERESVPTRLPVVHVALDAMEDREFWDHWSTVPGFGTPEYYAPFLERFPHRVAETMRAIATAPPGGVVYHCVRGRDRAGLVTILVLTLAGVDTDAIVADYALSQDDDADHGELIRDLVAGLDVEAYLRGGGLRDEEIAALRARLVE